MLTIDPHPSLDAIVFSSRWPAPLRELDAPAARAFLALPAKAPLSAEDDVRLAVRELLRQGGFKPTGRSKPASEYLLRAVAEGWLSPESGINPAVDVCNAVSLHSGLPISVVDSEVGTGPWRLGLCPPGTSYAFNPSGQVLDLGGLLALHDAEGPCGSPVKDSQRTKTHGLTRETLTVIWGTQALAGRTEATLAWYLDLLGVLGVVSERRA